MIIFIISSYAQKYLNKDFFKKKSTNYKITIENDNNPDVWSGYAMVQTHPSFTI